MNFINWLRALTAPPSALVIAARELEGHKRNLLNAQSSREYADGMCAYHMAAIDRLTNYLKEVE
jgi:hypothetical protein